MISRRRFSSLLGLSLLTKPLLRCGVDKQPSPIVSKPIILTTWNNFKANELAINSLEKGNALLDSLEAGIRHVESDPDDQSVGYGGRPDREGNVTLDASIMDHLGNAGSVTYLKEIMHPISVARLVMEKTPHVILSGNGARQFALAEGFKSQNLLTEKSKSDYKEWLTESKYKPIPNIEMHDTIGMLAMNASGDLSGGCSTSGMAYKMKGRVGDSPIIGAGLFVDNEVGAVTATGLGELVLKTCASFLVVELMRQGKSPFEACKEAIERIVKKYDMEDAQVGLIPINKKGETGAYSIRPGFVYVKTSLDSSDSLTADSYFK